MFSVQHAFREKSGKDVVSKSCTGLGFARDWLRWQNLWSHWLEYVISVARVSASPRIRLARRKWPLKSQNRLLQHVEAQSALCRRNLKTGFTLKTDQMFFCPHYAGGIKSTTITGNFWICICGKLGQGKSMIFTRDAVVFEKLGFQNFFRSRENEKWRFQIPQLGLKSVF